MNIKFASLYLVSAGLVMAPGQAQNISVRAGYGVDPNAERVLNEIAEPVVHSVPAGVHPHEVARRLCGRVSQTYVSLLAEANPGRPITPQRQSSSYNFPACFILRATTSIVPLEGETVAGLAERTVGTAGPRTVQRIIQANNGLKGLIVGFSNGNRATANAILDTSAPVTIPNATEPAVYRLRSGMAANPGEALNRLREAAQVGDRREWIMAADELNLESSVDPGLSEPVPCPASSPAPRADEQWPFDRAALISALSRNDQRRVALGRDPVKPVTIAVADNGVDGLFEVFTRGLLAINPGETPDDGIDNEPNGFKDDVAGVNLFSGRPPVPLEGKDPWHGTHLAALALGGRGFPEALGGAAVLPRLRLLPISMVEERRDGNLNLGTQTTYKIPVKGVFDAFRYAKRRGASVVNFSVSTREKLQTLEGELSLSPSILLVAAAGNQATTYDSDSLFPAAYGGVQHESTPLPVMSVAAHDRRGCLAAFSGRGAVRVDIAAPGVEIVSYGLDQEILPADGTSQATAIVSFTAGLLAAEGLTEAMAIRHRLLASVDLHPGLADYVVSQGALNVVKAVSLYDDVLELESAPGSLVLGRLETQPVPKDLCPQVSATTPGKVLKLARHPLLPGVMRALIRWRNNNVQFLNCRPSFTALRFQPAGAAAAGEVSLDQIRDLVVRN